MIARIESDGFIHIIAETNLEAYAINYLVEKEENHTPVVIDCSILLDSGE